MSCMDGRTRCEWSYTGNSELYIAYHDTEWGVPIHDDTRLFEFLVLEGAQAGLSWLTILKKRENYRKAFSAFDPGKVAKYGEKKIKSLLEDKGIIRNKLKINAAVLNARCFLEVQKEFGSFDKYVWGFVPHRKPIKNSWSSTKQVPARTEESDALSRDLKSRGFRFVGSTICYAHMQATGMVNDHVTNCFRYVQV